jgi:hypothetical protein
VIATFRPLLWITTAVIVLATTAGAQTPALRGTWSATGAGRTLQGTWTAEPVANRPDAVQGTWTLVNDASQTVMGGTWSAAKNARAWSGSWQARIVSRDNPNGRVVSGTWRGDAVRSSTATTLPDLLRRAQDQPATGVWNAAGRSGGWSLRTSP